MENPKIITGGVRKFKVTWYLTFLGSKRAKNLAINLNLTNSTWKKSTHNIEKILDGEHPASVFITINFHLYLYLKVFWDRNIRIEKMKILEPPSKDNEIIESEVTKSVPYIKEKFRPLRFNSARFFVNYFYDLWPKLWFLTRIVIFDQTCDFWPKLWFLTKIVIFDQNCDFWPQLWFLTKIVICDQNCDFWLKMWFLIKLWFLIQMWNKIVKFRFLILALNCDFCCENVDFFSKLSIFKQNVDFFSKMSIFRKLSILLQKLYFLTKVFTKILISYIRPGQKCL